MIQEQQKSLTWEEKGSMVFDRVKLIPEMSAEQLDVATKGGKSIAINYTIEYIVDHGFGCDLAAGDKNKILPY